MYEAINLLGVKKTCSFFNFSGPLRSWFILIAPNNLELSCKLVNYWKHDLWAITDLWPKLRRIMLSWSYEVHQVWHVHSCSGTGASSYKSLNQNGLATNSFFFVNKNIIPGNIVNIKSIGLVPCHMGPSNAIAAHI